VLTSSTKHKGGGQVMGLNAHTAMELARPSFQSQGFGLCVHEERFRLPLRTGSWCAFWSVLQIAQTCLEHQRRTMRLGALS